MFKVDFLIQIWTSIPYILILLKMQSFICQYASKYRLLDFVDYKD